METEKRQKSGKFVGDGFTPVPTNEVGDGLSLWDSTQDAPENGLGDWPGRRETHDMFHDSYD